MAQKMVYVKKIHRGRSTIWEGTIDYLVNNVFGYTLECGHSWNAKINRYPKTLKALVSALNKSVDETQGGCYDRDCYYESTREAFEAAESRESMIEIYAH